MFPILKPIAKVLGKVDDEGGNNKEHLLGDEENHKKEKKKNKKKKAKEQPKADEKEPDPLNYLGFGMIAYRDLMFTMFWLFAVLSVIMLPAMNFYSDQGAIEAPKGFASKYSIGNFGYSTSQCVNTPFSIGKLPMECPYGKLGKVNAVGVIPSTEAKKTYCHAAEAITNVCPLRSGLVESLPSLVKNGTIQFTNSDIFQDSFNVNAACTDADAKIFISFTCVQEKERLALKYEQTSMIACLGVLLVCVYLSVLHWFKRASDLNQMVWDMETITPGDYTVQMEISQKAYEYFIQNVYDREKTRKTDLSVGECLKSYIKRELEEVLTLKLQELKPENSELKINEVKIADIVFAFNNSQLITLLKQRGNHIMFQRYDKMREIEAQISNLKNEKYNELTRPVDAFITFEEEDGKIVAEEFEPKFDFLGRQKPSIKEFMNDDLFLIESTEPTNIIWENRHWTAADYAKRGFKVMLIIVFLLTISFLTIYACKSKAIANAEKYPAVNSNEIYKNFLSGDSQKLYDLAKNEIENYNANGEPMNGYY